MAWDRFHKTINSDGRAECTTGYMSETITLANAGTARTSILPGPYKSDMTILFKPSGALANDATVKVEHSVDGTTFITIGQFDTFTPATTDISHDMSIIGITDASAVAEENGSMFLYALDSHGSSRHIRFSVTSVGDDSGETGVFSVIPHF